MASLTFAKAVEVSSWVTPVVLRFSQSSLMLLTWDKNAWACCSWASRVTRKAVYSAGRVVEVVVDCDGSVVVEPSS